MKIVIVGSGYVGLVSGACFADFGHDVVCVDKAEEKIKALKNGVIPIFEPGLDRLVESNVKAGRLSFTTELAGPVADAEVVFIAVARRRAVAMAMRISAMSTPPPARLRQP